MNKNKRIRNWLPSSKKLDELQNNPYLNPHTFGLRGLMGIPKQFPLVPINDISFTSRKKIVYADHAPTGKGKCFKCRIRIVKGAPRSWYHDKMRIKGGAVKNSNWTSGDQMSVKRLLCYDCTIKHLEVTRMNTKSELARLTVTLKKFKRLSKMKKASRALDTQKLMDALEPEEGRPKLRQLNGMQIGGIGAGVFLNKP